MDQTPIRGQIIGDAMHDPCDVWVTCSESVIRNGEPSDPLFTTTLAEPQIAFVEA